MKVAVIAAHPDDEVLGCGGTMAWHAAKGDCVEVLIVSQGITSRIHSNSEDIVPLREMATRANQILGVKRIQFLEHPDNQMDSVPRLEVIQQVECFIQECQPQRIYTHHFSDVNIDHQRVHEAVLTASRPMPNSWVKELLFFEVASSTDWQVSGTKMPFVPNYFINIENHLAQKIDALGIYVDEMREFPHSRSVPALEALAKWRGASCGVKAAEAFCVGRIVHGDQ